MLLISHEDHAMPTITLSGLERQEHLAAAHLRNAFITARNRHSITSGDRGLVSQRKATDLVAANPYARIVWGEALWTSFLQQLDVTSDDLLPGKPLFWVTLVDLGCFMASNSTHVDLRSITNHLRSGLRDTSYLGMVDLGYYANIAPGTAFADRTAVSWHLHLFAWGENREQFRERIEAMNRNKSNYRPIIPNGTGAHWMEISAGTLAIKFRYMVRSPTKAYTVGRREVIGPEGELEFRFKHNHRLLRPGERIMLFHLLKQQSLEALTVAGGEGVNIRRQALRQIDREAKLRRR
jgi:hypothetical protein